MVIQLLVRLGELAHFLVQERHVVDESRGALPDILEPFKRALQSSRVDLVERGSEQQLVHDPFELDGVEMMLLEYAPEDFDLAMLPLLEKKQKV